MERKTAHVHCWGDKIILFQNVPAEVCKQCGENYFKPEVMEAFDKATEHLERIKRTIEIPVVPFSDLSKK